ncbi:MAG: hypothetical protein FGM24_06335 [Candidatus Kapabacteria bacterium]|nr:hypothetical protein [Candidatus Kapabacteria bacterium]
MAARRRNVGILVFCIVLATLLWGYVTLTRTYEDYISVRFAVITPTSSALLSTVPDRVTVRIRGTGWQLLNMRLMANANMNALDLSTLKPDDGMTYHVAKADILRAVVTTPGTQLLDVSPASLTLATGDVAVRRVPIRLRAAIACRDGFMTVGEPELEPATVSLRGSASVINKITSWPTERLVLEDQHSGTDVTVALSDSLSTLLSVSPATVRVRTDVQQIADLVVDGIPVEYTPSQRRTVVRIRPSRLSVVVRGGVKDLSSMTPQQFRAVIDDSMMLRGGMCRPRIQAPPTVTVVGTIPSILNVSVSD